MTNDKYILFYKPYGVLCQFTDKSNDGNKRSTLGDYIPVSSVYPVGRLDFDSEGLLLLTNNGKLQHRLSHPKFAHPRTYWVQVERIPDEKALDKLRSGVTISKRSPAGGAKYKTRKAKVKKLCQQPPLQPRNPPIRYRKTVPTCWLEIQLTEGLNRQVRRMTAAVGFPTLRLVRVAIALFPIIPHLSSSKSTDEAAILSLDGLKPGQWREVTATERKALQKLL